MVNDSKAVVSAPGEGAAASSRCTPPTDTAPIEESAWLAQATRLRVEAFRFAQNRIERDLAMGERREDGIDPGNGASRIAFPSTTTADYLAENERMAHLMRDLARKGLLASPRK